jgi:hypothetical protein
MRHAEPVTDDFAAPDLHPRWRPWTIGTGAVQQTEGTLRLALPASTDWQYSDAQITDYQGLARRDFPWQPPLRMTVRAWASHSTEYLHGTAGFGFWNEPFVPVGQRWPRLPRAVWFFFGSPPNDMALARTVPGHGWKAATLDATRLPFLLLAPCAPLGFLLMRSPALYRALWPVGQWALGVAEARLPVDLLEPHMYTLDWRADGVTFYVDGAQVLHAPYTPRGPLGFIAWIDNQYAVVTPQGRFRFGLIATQKTQSLVLDQIRIEPLQSGE